MKVSEIFGPVLQGEGDTIGTPTVFVRFGGCDYRCSWCDTLYAVLPEHRHTWKSMTAPEVMAEVNRLSPNPILVTLSGGNPAIQPARDMEELIRIGHFQGYTFTVETQGSVYADWFELLDYLTVSPKPPSSGMAHKLDLDLVATILRSAVRRSLKIVVFDDTDLDWALALLADPRIPPYTERILQVGNWDTATANTGNHALDLLAALDVLTQKVLERGITGVRVLPQLHVLLYGNKRGV